MKKITALFLSLLLALSLFSVASADMQFTDLSADHWAYANVQTLVAEGTIKGYEDGSFRPGGTVTRAEFVKMIGKGPDRYTADFSDVPQNHWAYEYVMYSGLVPQGSVAFLPDQQIKRSEVVELLWKRAGSKTDCTAPSIITSQAKNKQAVAWAYSCGILNGDDGVHLRMDDTMSRAEGAALILRAREKSAAGATASFVQTASEGLLRQAFQSLDLFDDPTYTPDKAVTYGELARAMVRIAGNEYDPSYFNMPSTVPFDHKYARDLDILGRNVIGTDQVTPEIIDKQVNVGDVIAALTYGAWFRSAKPYAIDLSTEEYKDIMPLTKNRLLTFAFKNGVQLDTQNSLESLNRAATLRDVAATLVQLDAFIGLQTDYSTETGALGMVKYNHSLDISGRYYDGYQLVLKDVPNIVYTAPFTSYGSADEAPKDSYRFAQSYNSIFATSLSIYRSQLLESGLDCTFIYYPSLTFNNGNGYTMRVKVTVNSDTSGTLGSYFKTGEKADASYPLQKGMSFYADVASGAPLASMTMDPGLMFIDQIIAE